MEKVWSGGAKIVKMMVKARRKTQIDKKQTMKQVCSGRSEIVKMVVNARRKTGKNAEKIEKR